jgi:hypothetical protein
MHTAYTTANERNLVLVKKGRSSIADVGLVRTSLLRAGWSRVKSFLFSRSEQSMSDFSFSSSILNKWHQQYSDKYVIEKKAEKKKQYFDE